MAGNRKAAELVVLTWIGEIDPSGKNQQLYKDRFGQMSDKEFDSFMTGLSSGEMHLSIIAPNLTDHGITTERNLKIAKKLGHEFFERIWVDRGDGTPRFLSPKKYLVVDAIVRRQAQLLKKKRSIPDHNNSVDDFTGQPTGASKGSKLSYPELQGLVARDLTANIHEMAKARGGDTQMFNRMNRDISRTGTVSLNAINDPNSSVKAIQTLNTLFKCMHLKANY